MRTSGPDPRRLRGRGKRAPRAAGLEMADLARRVRSERLRRGQSLETVSALARVSRSMLSAIERGARTPTVLLLDRIATALGTTIARLVGEEKRGRVIVMPRERQDVARDPSGWERRILSPVLPGLDFELMRTTIARGVDAGVFDPHAPGSREYVAVEKGSLRLTLAGTEYRLDAGDAIYYDGDCEHGFANRGASICVYYLAMDVTAGPPRAPHSIRAASGR